MSLLFGPKVEANSAAAKKELTKFLKLISDNDPDGKYIQSTKLQQATSNYTTALLS